MIFNIQQNSPFITGFKHRIDRPIFSSPDQRVSSLRVSIKHRFFCTKAVLSSECVLMIQIAVHRLFYHKLLLEVNLLCTKCPLIELSVEGILYTKGVLAFKWSLETLFTVHTYRMSAHQSVCYRHVTIYRGFYCAERVIFQFISIFRSSIYLLFR